MQIHEYEINDGLQEKIENDNSIAFDCEIIDLDPSLNVDEENIKKSLQLLEGSHLVGTVLNKAERHPTHQNY